MVIDTYARKTVTMKSCRHDQCIPKRTIQMTKRKTKDIPSKQRDYKVGHCRPPKEHQFKPGQTANPKGPPKRRTQLWVYINQFMAMTDSQLKKASQKRLTQAQQIALKLVENAKAGGDQKRGRGRPNKFV